MYIYKYIYMYKYMYMYIVEKKDKEIACNKDFLKTRRNLRVLHVYSKTLTFIQCWRHAFA